MESVGALWLRLRELRSNYSGISVASALRVSTDEMNRNIATVIIAPMTTKGKMYPTRIVCQFQGKEGQIVLDQIRTVDKTRLVKKLGKISQDEQRLVLDTLAELFAE